MYKDGYERLSFLKDLTNNGKRPPPGGLPLRQNHLSVLYKQLTILHAWVIVAVICSKTESHYIPDGTGIRFCRMGPARIRHRLFFRGPLSRRANVIGHARGRDA